MSLVSESIRFHESHIDLVHDQADRREAVAERVIDEVLAGRHHDRAKYSTADLVAEAVNESADDRVIDLLIAIAKHPDRCDSERYRLVGERIREYLGTLYSDRIDALLEGPQ